MKFKLLCIVILPFLLHGQIEKENIKVYNNNKLWFTKTYSNNKLHTILDSLVSIGFYTLTLDSLKKTENQTSVYINRGKFYKKVWVQLDSLSKVAIMNKDKFKTDNIDSLAGVIHYYYLKRGYAFNQVYTKLSIENDSLEASIKVELNQKRLINSFIIHGYTKIPRGIVKELEYGFLNKTYTDERLKEISATLQGTNFITEEKNPQVLFTPDSTKIFIYIKKRKASTFDGIIGFGSDHKDKFKVNGQLQLSLGNLFNSLETINLNWISTPEKSQNFEIQVNIPYLFKSKFGSESSLNIYKQDSTYATVRLNEHIYYQYTVNQRLGMEGLFENSRYITESDINNNFSKTGLGINYQYKERNENDILGPKNFYLVKGIAYRNIPENRKNLTEYHLSASIEKLIKISGSHYIKPRINASTLLSDTLTINELFKIGGLKTIRGFNEKSIYANAYIIGSLEYRYVPFEELFLNLFTDLAWIENKYQNSKPFLLGTGLGISFLTRFGIFSLNYAVGKYNSESINFSDSKIHIGIQATF
jgi:hemolysin activation/secretion protein